MPRSCVTACLALLLGALLGCQSDTASPPPAASQARSDTATAARVLIDGRFADWPAGALQHTDPAGDGASIDLERVWVSHDAERLYVRFETGAPLNLQEGNALALYLNTDGEASTGVTAHGAELVWRFGERTGTVVGPDGTQHTIAHEAIGFGSLPTVRANRFELTLDRSATPVANAPLFTADTLRVALAAPGDAAPDQGSIAYVVTPVVSVPDLAPRTLDRTEGTLRVVAYNVLRSRLFDAGARSAYTRLFKALAPDVWGFSEIYERSASATRQVVAELLPGPTWHAAKAGLDLVAVSRYPILDSYAIPGYDDWKSAAFVLDTRERWGVPSLFILMHPPCCNFADGATTRNEMRQWVVDRVAAFIRDVRAGTAPVAVPANAPIFVGGDMNFVGHAQQPNTLRTGDIIHNARLGPDAAPDWDRTPLVDARPRETHRPLHFTWIDPESSYPPGRLDYLYYSDSVLRATQSFVLNTQAMPPAVLSAHGLEASDTATASDHLPVVLDVRLRDTP
ncbi:endonuclease/exonuclease/phosphatase family protein [Salisaeta longa]|uniref:endonuclease/exonuclease/phosphatase family protein n=1 Tax=Salisaeta longa TaxID=503170 RepID=UPI0003B3D840|nr:endonuclease/exonuclease/phosphatase family protein [Salisaeta longa]